ncbi:pfh1, partial [Symbiodinium microadriaticum]
SQLLPLRDHRLQSVLLTRPNGQLTRAGQFYHSITGRRPPNRQFDEAQPLIRDGPNDYIVTRGGARKIVRSLQANGQYHVTKLGKAFFRDKHTEWLAHVPVIIRGRRRNGTPYERHDYLPVTSLDVGLSRQNVIDNRVDTQIRLRQPLGALREVSYQLFAGDQILPSAFEERRDMLCVPRQLAELLKLPLREVIEDFNSICPGNWQDRGKEERAVAFTSWNGHAFFYRSAKAVADCDESERRVRYRKQFKRDNPVP